MKTSTAVLIGIAAVGLLMISRGSTGSAGVDSWGSGSTVQDPPKAASVAPSTISPVTITSPQGVKTSYAIVGATPALQAVKSLNSMSLVGETSFTSAAKAAGIVQYVPNSYGTSPTSATLKTASGKTAGGTYTIQTSTGTATKEPGKAVLVSTGVGSLITKDKKK